MSDENHAETPQDTDHREPQAQMVYESNPKHRDPWQIGKKGSSAVSTGSETLAERGR